MELAYCIVDSFTLKAFTGNPAAVVITDRELDATLMQTIAAEFNLSETAFVVRNKTTMGLRWFTPTIEVDLCGHATLAAAKALWSNGFEDDLIRFSTLSGELTCTRSLNEQITMSFPLIEVVPCPEASRELVKSLVPQAVFVGMGGEDWIVALPKASDVETFAPDFAKIENLGRRGFVITAPGLAPFDFVSRAFFPQLGIPEDPVTGSTHCALASYWSKILGKTSMKAKQLSNRSGELQVTLDGSRCQLRGDAVVVGRGLWTFSL